MFEKFRKMFQSEHENIDEEVNKTEEVKDSEPLPHIESDRLRAEKEELYTEVTNYVNFFYVEPEVEPEPEPEPEEEPVEEITYPDIFPLRDGTTKFELKKSYDLDAEAEDAKDEPDEETKDESLTDEETEEEKLAARSAELIAKHSAGRYASAANHAVDTIRELDKEIADIVSDESVSEKAPETAAEETETSPEEVVEIDINQAGHQFSFSDLAGLSEEGEHEESGDEHEESTEAPDSLTATGAPIEATDIKPTETETEDTETNVETAKGAENSEAAEETAEVEHVAEETDHKAHYSSSTVSHDPMDKYSGEVPDDPVKAQRQDQMQTAILWAMVDKPENTFGNTIKRLMDKEGLSVSDLCSRMRLDHRLLTAVTDVPDFIPSKQDVLAICFALEIKWEDAIKLMYKCGYIFSDEEKYDLTNEYLMRKKVYDIDKINDVLDHFGFPTYGIV